MDTRREWQMKPEFKLAKRMKGPSQIERVRAARAILNGTHTSEKLVLSAFIDILHPEISDERKRCIVADME